MIRVVIADDIQILRQGLKAILSQDEEIQVTGLAADGKEAFECCRSCLLYTSDAADEYIFV